MLVFASPAALAGPVSVSLPALLHGASPALTGGGHLESCDGEPTRLDQLQAAIDEVEGHLNYAELEAASQALEQARQALLCLAEPLPGNLAARVSFLAGARSWLAGDRSTSEGHFLEALRFRDSLEWDPAWTPEMRGPFETARHRRKVDPTSWLRVVPQLEEGLLWVDGLPVEDTGAQIALGPGIHYVQLGGAAWTTLRLDLPPAGANVLWLPESVPEEARTWVEDKDRRADLDQLLSLALPAGSELTITTDTRIWQGYVGEGDWTQIERARHPWRWVSLGGVAVAGGSLVVAGGGYVGAWLASQDSYSALDDDDWSGWQQASQRHGMSRQLYLGGLVGLGAGALLAGTGFAVDRWGFGLAPTADGLGVTAVRSW